MKKVYTLLLALIFLPLSTQAVDYKEGMHYKVIKQTASATPEVSEFFSFYCNHCFSFEPQFNELKSSFSDVPFKKNHINFLGGDMGSQMTRAYAAAEMLEVGDKFAEAAFQQIQVQRQAIIGEQGILAVFAQIGINEQEAKSALANFAVDGLASQMKRNTETFNIRGVPTLIVNGKYQVNRASAPTSEELAALVDYLLKKTD